MTSIQVKSDDRSICVYIYIYIYRDINMIMFPYMHTYIYACRYMMARADPPYTYHTYPSYAGMCGLSTEMLSPPGPAPRVSWPANYLRVFSLGLGPRGSGVRERLELVCFCRFKSSRANRLCKIVCSFRTAPSFKQPLVHKS